MRQRFPLAPCAASVQAFSLHVSSVSLALLLCASSAFAARLANTNGVDTTDLTAPGGTFMSSATHNSYPAARLFDDNASSVWWAKYAAGNMYAVYTFASPTVIDAFMLKGGDALYCPRGFRLRGSNDFDGSNYAAATWTDLDEEYERAGPRMRRATSAS